MFEIFRFLNFFEGLWSCVWVVDLIVHRVSNSREQLLHNACGNTRTKTQNVRNLVLGGLEERVDWKPVPLAKALTVTANADGK